MSCSPLCLLLIRFVCWLSPRKRTSFHRNIEWKYTFFQKKYAIREKKLICTYIGVEFGPELRPSACPFSYWKLLMGRQVSPCCTVGPPLPYHSALVWESHNNNNISSTRALFLPACCLRDFTAVGVRTDHVWVALRPTGVMSHGASELVGCVSFPLWAGLLWELP
jgi:hypothetical protein